MFRRKCALQDSDYKFVSKMVVYIFHFGVNNHKLAEHDIFLMFLNFATVGNAEYMFSKYIYI
jgi:hypothetical protein